MLLADVHAHLDMMKDLDNVINRAKKAGVKAIITNGVNPEANRESLELAKKYPDIVKAAMGIYPPDALGRETNQNNFFDFDKEIEFIKKNKDKIIAIGEMGLDYKNGRDKSLQKDIFTKLVNLAREIDKPLIVHSRSAEADVVELLEAANYKKIVMHCFHGKSKLVDRIIANDWYFSIPCNVVRTPQIQNIVQKAPLNRLLTETDAPFLSPFPGKQNEPAFMIESIKKIAEIKQLDAEETANIIFMNYKKLFE